MMRQALGLAIGLPAGGAPRAEAAVLTRTDDRFGGKGHLTRMQAVLTAYVRAQRRR